jgi:hypothetical protein
VTVGGEGRIPGAVYTPLAEIVPIVGFPPVTAFTFQVTVVFVVPVTPAVNACGSPSRTPALVG